MISAPVLFYFYFCFWLCRGVMRMRHMKDDLIKIIYFVQLHTGRGSTGHILL